MARIPSESLTEREAQIMDVVWRLGEVTAEEVRVSLPGEPHDSTVRTIMRLLESKGYLTHEATGQGVRLPGGRGSPQGPAAGASRGAEPVLRGFGGEPGAAVDRRRTSVGRATGRAQAVGPVIGPQECRKGGES